MQIAYLVLAPNPNRMPRPVSGAFPLAPTGSFDGGASNLCQQPLGGQFPTVGRRLPGKLRWHVAGKFHRNFESQSSFAFQEAPVRQSYEFTRSIGP